MKLLLLLFMMAKLGLAAHAPPNPNTVYILADDMGYGDVHVLNPDRCKIATPHMDRLAAEGMIFTDAHTWYGITASLDLPPYVWIRDRNWVAIGTNAKAFRRPGPASEDFEAIDVLGKLKRESVKFISEYKGAFEEMSPYFYFWIKKDSPPLLMMQGDTDATIPLPHAIHLKEKADRIGADVEMIIVKNAGHNWRKAGGDPEPGVKEIKGITAEYALRQESWMQPISMCLPKALTRGPAPCPNPMREEPMVRSQLWNGRVTRFGI